MHRPSSFLVFALLAPVLLPGCDASDEAVFRGASGRPLAADDVAFLLPPAASDLPGLPAEVFTDQQWTFIEQRLGKFNESAVPFQDQVAALSLVAVRFEACFECLGSALADRVSVRLIYQPRFAAGEDHHFGDGGIHLVFVERDTSTASYAEFRHAALEYLARQASIATEKDRVDLVKRFIGEHLTTARLDHFTTIHSGRSTDNWRMELLRFAPDEGLFVNAPSQSGFFSFTTRPGFRGMVVPAAVPEVVRNQATLKSTPPETLRANLAPLEQVLDPARSDTSNTTCVDCHAAINTAHNLRLAFPDRNDYLALTSGFPTLQALADAPANLAGSILSIRGLGYHGSEPAVSAYVLRAALLDADRFQAMQRAASL